MNHSFQQYLRAILDAWPELLCTRGQPPRSDRALVLALYRRAVPLSLVLLALRLACARRSPHLPPVRSLAYFCSVIDELLQADPAYLHYLSLRL